MTGPHPPAFDFQPLLADVTGDFAEAVRAADLDAPVAACPGWQVRDLVGHLGRIHRWATDILGYRRARRRSPTGRSTYATPTRRPTGTPSGPARLLRGGRRTSSSTSRAGTSPASIRSAASGRAGRSTRPGCTCSTSTRRVGATAPFDPALSADGVHEVFQVFFPRQAHARASRST